MAGGLAEPQQGFEDLDLGPVQLGGIFAQESIAVVDPQLVVAAPLLGFHVAVEGLLGLLGQVLDDLLLGAAEDERPQGLGQQDAVGSRRAGAGPPLAYFLKTVSLPSMPGLRNSKIDQSSPRWFSIGVPLMARRCRAAEQAGGLGRLAVGVLDRLGLVEDHVVELEVGQLGDIGAERAVGGDDQVVLGERLAQGVAARAGVVEHAEPGRELGGLLDPVEDQRARHDRQRRSLGLAAGSPPLEQGQDLDRLAQTHVVGEDAAEAEPLEVIEPAQPLALIGPQLAVEAGR